MFRYIFVTLYIDIHYHTLDKLKEANQKVMENDEEPEARFLDIEGSLDVLCVAPPCP